LPYKSLVLPFIVDKSGEKPFTPELEPATVVCLAEAQRKKGGLLSSSVEKIAFISKVHYPIWLVPWEDRCLLVDGLGIPSYEGAYAKPPDLKRFIEDLKRSSVSRGDFKEALGRHLETFKDFIEVAKVSVKGLITQKGLLSALPEYLGKGKVLEDSSNESLDLIPPELGEEQALKACDKVVKLWRLIKGDVKGLQQALKLLDEMISLHEHGIQCEIERIREEYGRKISNLTLAIEDKVKKLIQKRDSEIKKVEKAIEKKLKSAMRRMDRSKHKLQRLERNEIAILKKIEHFKRKGREAKAAYWGQKLRECRREIGNVEREIKSISSQIEKIKREGEERVKDVKESFERTISLEKERIRELEALRDSEIKGKQKELEELKFKAEHISSQIEELINRKEKYASTLRDETTIPLRLDETALTHIPLYLVKYEGEEGKARYGLHPPMLASSPKGILKKIRKIWRFSLESRIKLLISPFSKDLEKMLNSALIERIRKDEAFREKIDKICCSNNLLGKEDFDKLLTDGMNQLKRQELVKLEEAMAILKRYGGVKE